MGSFRFFQSLLEPLIGAVRYMPASAFIPLLIIWLGIGDAQKVGVVFIGVFFPLTLLIADVSAGVPKELINIAYTLGASRWQVFSRVLLPASLPGVVDNLRITMGWAWTYLIVAELVGRPERDRPFDPAEPALPGDGPHHRQHPHHRAARGADRWPVPAPLRAPLPLRGKAANVSELLIRNVSVWFDDRQRGRVLAVDDVSAAIADGSSSASSDPPAAASRRCSMSSAGSSMPTPVRSSSMGSQSPGRGRIGAWYSRATRSTRG